MLIKDLIGTYPAEREIRFEYCYLDEKGDRIVAPELFYEGAAGAFAHVMEERAPMVLRLYATCGECNDFEVDEKEELTGLRFIDFR